jgi:hypothetical protein
MWRTVTFVILIKQEMDKTETFLVIYGFRRNVQQKNSPSLFLNNDIPLCTAPGDYSCHVFVPLLGSVA